VLQLVNLVQPPLFFPPRLDFLERADFPCTRRRESVLFCFLGHLWDFFFYGSGESSGRRRFNGAVSSVTFIASSFQERSFSPVLDGSPPTLPSYAFCGQHARVSCFSLSLAFEVASRVWVPEPPFVKRCGIFGGLPAVLPLDDTFFMNALRAHSSRFGAWGPSHSSPSVVSFQKKEVFLRMRRLNFS